MSPVQKIINDLKLSAHPEGGYYRRLYENPLETSTAGGDRPLNTAIIYLLSGQQFSAFHRIRSDELWFLGDHNSEICLIELADNNCRETVLNRQNPVHCIRAGNWFAAELLDTGPNSYAISYCSVSPGFDFADFELANRETLEKQYPEYQQRIQALCHTSRL